MAQPDDDTRKPKSLWLARASGQDSPLAELSQDMDLLEIAREVQDEVNARVEEQMRPFTTVSLHEMSDIILD